MKLFKTILYLSYPVVVIFLIPIVAGIVNNSPNSILSVSFQRLLFVTAIIPSALATIAGYYKLPFKTLFSNDSLVVVMYVLIDLISIVVGFRVNNSEILETAILMTGGAVWFTLSYVIVSMITAYSFLWLVYRCGLLFNTPLKPRI